MITTLDTTSWAKELSTGNAEFVETADNILYIVSNVRNNGFGFGSGFGKSFASPYQFVVLKSDPVPPSPGPGATFGALPPNSVPVATFTFPQPTTSFDPAVAFDAGSGILHILGSRDTPTGGTTSSNQTSDLVKFSFDTNTNILTGPTVVGGTVGTRVRGAYDIEVLDTGNTILAASLTDPSITSVLLTATIQSVAVSGNLLTVTVAFMPTPFVAGQWVLLDDLTNATFLNGAVLQTLSATPTQFTANFQIGNYPNTPDTGVAEAVGSSLLAVELDPSDNPVPGSATILASSPSRSGDTYDGVSIVVSGSSVELYYQSHPKLVTFADQQFKINLVGRNLPPNSGFGFNFGNNFGIPIAGFGFDFGYDFGNSANSWTPSPITLFSFSARYSDDRLTVMADNAGNRYLSLTYFSQLNHPEGIVGNVLMGNKLGSQPWFFHPTFGTTVNGSIIQSTISISRNGTISLVYLLEPFVPVTIPPQTITAAFPLKVASVNPTTLGLTDVPGFYNNANFTWLRGTKSLVDNASEWAVVGEREILANVIGEAHTIPPLLLPNPPFIVQVNNSSSYFEDLGVHFTPSGVALTRVDTNPQQGQYTVETSIGLYTFSAADAGRQIAISYNYITQILPVYASLFNVPPVSAIAPTFATVWRGGTFYATDVESITTFSITGNVITVTVPNDFTPGQQIAIYGFAHADNQFLNGNTLVVNTASATQFTANFTHANYTASTMDAGQAAVLIPGKLTISAAGSTDADSDALQFIWSENDPKLADVFLTTTGSQATVNVLNAVGPANDIFDVGVAVIDLFPNLVTQRHPALIVNDIQVTTGVLSITITAPAGALVPIAGEQVMLWDIVLGAPTAPTFNILVGGSLSAQGASGFGLGALTNDTGFGYAFGEDAPLSLIVTYVNGFGETVGSANTLFVVPANHLLQVVSPITAGDAEFYNVYVGLPGNELLQTLTPILLGANWTEPLTGFISPFISPPIQSGAIQEFLNDEVFTLIAGTNATTLVANLELGFGFDFGFDFGSSSFPLTAVTGFAISQFQFATTTINVPMNVAPIATFPAPAWNPGNILATSAARNTRIFITPGAITSPTTQFPVVYTGITDPDDVITYLWAQVSGTPVTLPLGITSPSLAIDTNGVNMNGESLVFSLTINDGINPPFVTQFTVAVAAFVFTPNNTDDRQLSRSVFATSATVNNVRILNGVGTISTPTNNFTAGQTVWFENLTGATFLNGATFTVLPTGFGSAFGVGFGAPSLSPTVFQIYDPTLPNYGPAADNGTAFSAMPISARNTAQSWSPLDISIIFNNLRNVKRVSVLDGSDRYIVISPFSVLVYAVFPSATPAAVLLRKLFLPNANTILDAVHTEQDYTLVLDSGGNILRYGAASFINTDNPDTTLRLIDFTSLSFADTDLTYDVQILTTVSFGNQRVVVVGGEQGAVLLQMNTTTLAVTGIFELDVASNFVYGASKIQFVRFVNMDNLQSGRILLGTIINKSATVTNVALTTNALTVTCQNTFNVGDVVALSGLTTATFLNGLTVTVIAVTTSTFTASFQHPDYASAADTGTAAAQNAGTTYETLIDLSKNQIIGTFDKSKLRNQFVETGEILFEPDDTYAGGPTPPVLLPPTSVNFGGTLNIQLTWQMPRPDLINSYTVQLAIEAPVSTTAPSVAPFQFTVPAVNEFTADEGVFDSTIGAPLVRTFQTSPLTGQYFVDDSTGTYTFAPSQSGHTVVMTIRQAFNNFQIVNSGNVQSIFIPLPPGSTYFFRVQASGLDGVSGFSNIESITI